MIDCTETCIKDESLSIVVPDILHHSYKDKEVSFFTPID